MLRKMGKSGLEVQEIKKDIKNQKFEIQKKKKKWKPDKELFIKQFFQLLIIFSMDSRILNISMFMLCQIALLYMTMQEWIHLAFSVCRT